MSLLATVILGSACLPVSAQADFGLREFDVTFANQDGSPAAHAGSHPFAFTTALKANVSGEEPQGRLRTLFLDELPGLLANPMALPARCKDEDFETLVEGVNDCPDVTAVGVFQGASGEPDAWTTSPVFSLVPPPGVLMRLGFRVAGAANAIVDFELSPEPPYRPLATVGEFPRAIELFGARLQLWGVPASPSHDGERGWCAVHGERCPAPSYELPFLTLPTSCEGPQATYYEALSWEGDEDAGDVFTHDGSEPPNPLGFVDCGKLSFDPSMIVGLTSEAAQSPSGLDLTVTLSDEGLLSPESPAQSQLRELALTLPEGLAIDPAATEALQHCTEAELEAESLEANPGEGCPAASELGTVEVETPLAEESLEGTVFAAEPSGEAGLPSLYVVIENDELGVVVKQVIEIERDPETGQLVAYAEDMPQLPFTRLRLHLREGPDAPLVTPGRCASYDGHDAAHEPIRAELTPWSGEAPVDVASSFGIVSGPGGGPCPAGAGRHERERRASAPEVAAPTPTRPGATAPRVTVRKLKLRRRRRSAVFTFVSSEPGSHFRCKLDRRRPARCISPEIYRHLEPGRHRFEVWAIEAGGAEDSRPAVRRFEVAGHRGARAHRRHRR